ncbi:MAG: hypothetical protein M9961_14415 [Ilumatobacteraceae bacterium]|nr:hypothetical protein [Ilumatobacteraceae bacterium]
MLIRIRGHQIELVEVIETPPRHRPAICDLRSANNFTNRTSRAYRSAWLFDLAVGAARSYRRDSLGGLAHELPAALGLASELEVPAQVESAVVWLEEARRISLNQGAYDGSHQPRKGNQ